MLQQIKKHKGRGGFRKVLDNYMITTAAKQDEEEDNLMSEEPPKEDSQEEDTQHDYVQLHESTEQNATVEDEPDDYEEAKR